MSTEDPQGHANGQAQEPRLYCEVSRRLMEAFAETVRQIVLLHEQQFRAILDGDPDANRFDLLLHDANERKQNAKYAYMSHLEQHGCERRYDESDNG